MSDRSPVAGVLAAGVVGYAAGTFPSADVASRLAGPARDVRGEGSGNPGALNAAAVLGPRWGVAVLIADLAKGAAAGALGRALAGDTGAYLAATAAIAGHIAPVWNGFRGGKGVATSAGACLAVFPAYFPIDAGVAALSAATSPARRTVDPGVLDDLDRGGGALVAPPAAQRLGSGSERRPARLRGGVLGHDPGQVPSSPEAGFVIGIVTDSASMLPPAWRERFGIAVAPVTVVVDGTPYQEGVELDGAEFYRRLATGAEVSTAAPSPGDLLATYRSVLDDGAASVVAIHTGADYSATMGAATIAARDLPEVELVDSGTVSFPVSLCIAAACDARAGGADAGGVAAAARAAAREVDSVFIVGAPDLAQQGGRLGDTVARPELTILGLGPDGLRDLGSAGDLDDAIARMASLVAEAAQGRTLRVGVGDADRPELGERLAAAIDGSSGVAELIRYEVGPSVGAHSGPGTVGAVWAPR